MVENCFGSVRPSSASAASASVSASAVAIATRRSAICAKVGVRLRPRETGQQRDIGHAGNGSRPYPDIVIGRGKLLDHAPVFRIVRYLRNRRGADRRVGVLPSGLWLESVEERHREPCNLRITAGELRRW
jgi:hypothetical protein